MSEGFFIEKARYRLELHVKAGERPWHQLVLEPYPTCSSAFLNAQIEQRQDQGWVMIQGSERRLDPTGPFMTIVVEALNRGELIGESALHAAHAVFWRCLVENDEGLAYIKRYAPHSHDCYLLHRLYALTETDDAVAALWEVWGKTVIEGDNLELLRQVCNRVQDDADFADAIRALVATSDAKDIQATRVHQFITSQIEEA